MNIRLIYWRWQARRAQARLDRAHDEGAYLMAEIARRESTRR
jgi:hypothetical protein